MKADAGVRTVVVTGASRGIGIEICRTLIVQGYHLVGMSRTLTSEYEKLADGASDRVDFVECDLAASEGLQLACERLRQITSLFALVNNAGLARAGLHATLPRAEMETMLALNLLAPMVLSQVAAKAMIRRRAGRIVNISSVAARRPYRGLASYSATKAGLEGFTRVLAAECGTWGITVNCIAPGFVDTQMSGSMDGDLKAQVRRRSMMPDPLTTVDVAAATAFLLSDGASAITAEVIRVDGGSAA